MFEGVSENGLRAIAFFAAFALLALIEIVRPRRTLVADKTRRWMTNLSIIAIGTLAVRAMAQLAVPVAGVAAAVYAAENNFGLLQMIAAPAWLEIVIAIVVLDFAIWLQHVASHKLPALWRLHQVHHADIDIDVTTALRFHPVEIALSMVWKVVCVLALGAAPIAVILFEIILNAGAMFSHANIRIADGVDRWLRLLVVTPDMHRVHHSVQRREHNTNFGFNLSIWDRLFSTYTRDPAGGHTGMKIGLSNYPAPEPTWLWWSLRLPFRRPPPET